MLFHHSGSLLFTATVTSSYSGILDGSVVPNTEFTGLSSTCPFDYTLWHHCFAHLNHSSVKKLIQSKLVDGIQLDSTATPDPICEPCIVGKQTCADVPKSVSSCHSNLLELMYTDVHGPLPVCSCEGHYQYWITFICDASRWWALIPLQKKSDAFAAFKQYKAYAENQTGCKIKVIKDDKGGEFMSKEWENLCIDEGIKREHTFQSITAMLSESCLPSHFWWDAVTAYVHVRNRSPTSAVKDATPFEVWHQKQPDVSHFWVFGCTAYVHIKLDQRKQLQSHTMKCVFIGYPADFKGWKFWSPDTKHTIVSNSVIFDEHYHPGTSKSPIDLSVPGDPVEARGDKHNQVEFDLPQSPSPLPPAPPAPPPVTAPSPSPSPSPKPSPPAPKSPLPPSSPPAPLTPDPLDSLKCECSVSVGSSPPRKYWIVDNPPPPPPLPTPSPGLLHNSFRDRDMVGNLLRGLHGYHIPQPPTTAGPDFDQYRESSIDTLDVMSEEEEEELLAQAHTAWQYLMSHPFPAMYPYSCQTHVPTLSPTFHDLSPPLLEWSEIAYPALDHAFNIRVNNTTSLDNKAAAVVKAMVDALTPFTSIAKLKKTEVAWWTPHCAELLKAIGTATTTLKRSSACQAFKRGVHTAKRTYYSDQAKGANLTNISILHHFLQRTPPPRLDAGLPPAPPPPSPVPPLLASELEAVLAGTSNLSAPGPSGISYCPLKWVVMHYPAEVLALFNDCLRLGHHPECWWAAKVVMLRKPNKKDPFSPQSYRPITLEETLGKLLEKIIANWLQFLANEEDWLPPNQYGRRQGHSVYDTSQHLLQIVKHAHSKGLVCSILVVDIQGFFDSVHLTLLHQQLVSMGCPLNMVDWCLSFMTGCSVSISFDRTTLPTAPKPDLGTPQGSPVSPILLTIFAGLAIQHFQQPSCNLLTYVDNHLIICIGPNIASNCETLAAAYCQLDGHFLRLGLNIEAVKTEALHFHPPWRTVGYDNWRTTGIQITPTTIIKPTNPLHWLGIWWDPGLSFKAYVERMCSKGLSTLAVLCILGNTERSILLDLT
ncbi:hypothetical protein M0805_007945, partial [Coniferiporia weirii]